MAFKNANVANRELRLISGRVICFTDSRYIEYVERSLRFSYPLFASPDGYSPLYGVAFMVELDGYLSFDVGSTIHLVEVGSFQQADFDPRRFAVVKAADVEVITKVTPNITTDSGYFRPSGVTLTTDTGNVYSFGSGQGFPTEAEARAFVDQYFTVGKAFTSPTGYYPFYSTSGG